MVSTDPPLASPGQIERTILTRTHGRYLVSASTSSGEAAGMLVGFHGYAESAETQLERLRQISGSAHLVTVSIQALNRFYERRSDRVVAGWMTRQDRELAIADNLAYIVSVIQEAGRTHPSADRIVFAGFSQGVAMAFRAAAASGRRVAGVIAVGGDVPPELETERLRAVGAALVCRGIGDGWYTEEIFRRDLERLREASVAVSPLVFPGGHDWSQEVIDAAARFLSERLH